MMLARPVASVLQFLEREDGPTTVEYAVLLCLMIVVCVSGIATIGHRANRKFTNVARNEFPGGASKAPRIHTGWYKSN
jgi:pilus assembly protein Flp/PilA